MAVILDSYLSSISNFEEGDIIVRDDRNLNLKESNTKIPRIAILNLMPNKVETETQFLEIFSSIPFKVYLDFIYINSYIPSNCNIDYLRQNYKFFEDIKDEKYDGMIITGAPVEKMEFEDVEYWEELKNIMEYTKNNVKSTFYICWGAQAGLYYHYGINKYVLDKKVFGVFSHNKEETNPLFKGFDDDFLVPHSRYTEIRREDIEKINDIKILSESQEAGVFLVGNNDGSQVFATGHIEYDAFTLKKEYERDKAKGLEIDAPKNYFEKDSNEIPKIRWKGHCTLLFTNWVKHYILSK